MNLYNEEQENKFLELRVQGKSLKTISKEIDIPTDVLQEWEFELADDILNAKSIEYDRIIEERDLTSISRFKYLTELYEKLRAELDKRDFSGLPTDKVYIILNDVYERIHNKMNDQDNTDWYDDDGYDPMSDLPEELE
jgi:hypothetical protein